MTTATFPWRACLLSSVLLAGVPGARPATSQQTSTGAARPVGAVRTVAPEAGEQAPRPVRNDVHRGDREIVTLRYFRIKKDSFDQFLRASQEGVWPYFEKIGARVIGMWRVTGHDRPPAATDDAGADYDEVYLATRYASVEHWQSTRDAVALGGDGPDWQKCRAALDLRRGLTLETHLTFLEGAMASNGPYFLPGLGERYERVPGGER